RPARPQTGPVPPCPPAARTSAAAARPSALRPPSPRPSPRTARPTRTARPPWRPFRSAWSITAHRTYGPPGAAKNGCGRPAASGTLEPDAPRPGPAGARPRPLPEGEIRGPPDRRPRRAQLRDQVPEHPHLPRARPEERRPAGGDRRLLRRGRAEREGRWNERA